MSKQANTVELFKDIGNYCNEGEEYIWDDMVRELNPYIKKINRWGYLRIEVENFGWMKRNGYKYIKTLDADTLLYKLLPNCECTMNIYYDTKNKSLKIQNFHHDNCTGSEWYTITSAKRKDYDKFRSKFSWL